MRFFRRLFTQSNKNIFFFRISHAVSLSYSNELLFAKSNSLSGLFILRITIFLFKSNDLQFRITITIFLFESNDLQFAKCNL